MKNSRSNILLLTAFCISLIISRALYIEAFHFRYLIWNLFLAFIPYLLSEAMIKKENQNSKWINLMIIPLIVLFLPNSIYLITDIIHLRKRAMIPLWFDTIIFFSFGLLGLLLSTLSLINIEKEISKYFSTIQSKAIILFIILLIGLGVYLGRFERWNSWDIVSNPYSLFRNIIEVLTLKKTWCIIAIFSCLQIVFWKIIKQKASINPEN